MALFAGLYAVVGILDHTRLNMRRYWLALPFGLLGVFLFNILRVAVLLLLAYYWNQDIAFSLFHTYAGMIFFIVYTAIFWRIFYRHMLNPTTKNNDKITVTNQTKTQK